MKNKCVTWADNYTWIICEGIIYLFLQILLKTDINPKIGLYLF